MIWVILATVGLVVLTVALHMASLAGLATIWQHWVRKGRRPRLVFLVLAAMVAHLGEIVLFAAGIYGLVELGDCGRIGDHVFPPLDYFYWSAQTYTSLGGSFEVTGDLRLLIAVEALTGLVLITWTASFFFLVMQRMWDREAR
jgi:hypothetical protein